MCHALFNAPSLDSQHLDGRLRITLAIDKVALAGDVLLLEPIHQHERFIVPSIRQQQSEHRITQDKA